MTKLPLAFTVQGRCQCCQHDRELQPIGPSGMWWCQACYEEPVNWKNDHFWMLIHRGERIHMPHPPNASTEPPPNDRLVESQRLYREALERRLAEAEAPSDRSLVAWAVFWVVFIGGLAAFVLKFVPGAP